MSYIHREGKAIIVTTFVTLTALNIVAFLLFATGSLWPFAWLIISFILLIWVIAFFRNPSRNFTINDKFIIAPADGKVVVIEQTDETEYFHEPRQQVSIFMSPLNVHVNRYPIGGMVKYQKYHAGKYLVAWHPKSSTLNERTSIVIENKRGGIMVRQIAGTMARRIVCYSNEGEKVEQTAELGFIKFGSRVDLFLPLDTKIKVRLGQKVLGGITKIAEY